MSRSSQHFAFEADLSLGPHQRAISELLASYMSDPMGDAPIHTPAQNERLINGLRQHPTAFVMLVGQGVRAVGMATCFVNYSTFQLAPFVNIHDIVVLPSCRGKGFGKLLLHAVEARALTRGCSQVTLEVREDNNTAKQMYQQFGFVPCNPSMAYYKKKTV